MNNIIYSEEVGIYFSSRFQFFNIFLRTLLLEVNDVAKPNSFLYFILQTVDEKSSN